MPSSARKSSLGNSRRGLQKAHIPYRGDNPEVGKKTGIAVQHVERKSDGFEPFEEILQQADKRTPPKPKGRKSKQQTPFPMNESDDENGEMSMELDDSPLRYFSDVRPPSTPSHLSRVGSSGRLVARTSDIDYDNIPSPHRQTSHQRAVNNAGPGPSRLRNSTTNMAVDSDSDDGGGGFAGDYDAGNNDFEDYGQQEDLSQNQTSFSAMDQDDDDNEATPRINGHRDTVEDNSTSTRRSKGKRRSLPEEMDDPVENDEAENEIAEGLQDIGEGSDTEEMNEPEVQQPKSKKAKHTKERQSVVVKSRSKKENRPHREGVRRSAREHYAPLEWWRGEKLVYGKRESSGPVYVPVIKEIRRIPKEDPVRLGIANKRKRGSTRARSKSKGPSSVALVRDPEEGWDDDTPASGTVWSYENQDVCQRRIAWTKKMVQTRMAADNGWSFQKIFGDGDFVAAGQLIIPPRGRKPSKGAKDNTYVFYVIEGAVNLKIHETSMILATGGMFMVPRGNVYFIENIAERDAKLFFAQAREVVKNDENGASFASKQDTGRSSSRHKSVHRGSSAVATGTVNPDGNPSHHSNKRAMTTTI